MGEANVKKCFVCGRFFVPDKRVGDRAKACGREQCQKERKRLAQFKWSKKNPRYFADRYEYVRSWRENRTSQRVQNATGKGLNKSTWKRKTRKRNGGNDNGCYKG